MKETSFPLSWPAGWKRHTPNDRRVGRFSKGERRYSTDGQYSHMRQNPITVAESIKRILAELGSMGIEDGDAIISTNIPVKLNGLPYSGSKEPTDPGVAVYWREHGAKQAKCMAIDQYTNVADNLAAIAATLYAMRAIERHGGAEILERAFLGFQALPPPMNGGRPWQDVLGVDANCSVDAAEISYRIRAKSCHPDQGGDADKMAELNDAIRQAREALSR